MSSVLWLGPARDGEAPLVDLGGPLARATSPWPPTVPAEVRLHVYTYECLERLRELAQEGKGCEARLLFWPASLFAAAGLGAHAAAEVERAFPTPARICWRPWEPAGFRGAAAQLFGRNALDVEAYGRDLERRAEAGGWSRA